MESETDSSIESGWTPTRSSREVCDVAGTGNESNIWADTRETDEAFLVEVAKQSEASSDPRSEMSITIDTVRDPKEELERLKKSKPIFMFVLDKDSETAKLKRSPEIIVPVYNTELTAVKSTEKSQRDEEIRRRSVVALATRSMIKFEAENCHICVPFEMSSLLFTALFIFQNCWPAIIYDEFEYRSSYDHCSMVFLKKKNEKKVRVSFFSARIEKGQAFAAENGIVIEFSSLDDLHKKLFSITKENAVVRVDKVMVVAMRKGDVYPGLLCCPLESLNLVTEHRVGFSGACVESALGKIRMVHREAYSTVDGRWEVEY